MTDTSSAPRQTGRPAVLRSKGAWPFVTHLHLRHPDGQEEIRHARSWEPGHISWWVGGINLIGCIAFMASALLAFVPPHALPFDMVTPSLAFTLIGAIAFFIGALLLLPETAAAKLRNAYRDYTKPMH